MVEFLNKLQKIGWLLGLVIIGYLGESGQDGGFIRDIWASLKTASPPVAMVLFMLFIDERRERREAQRQCNDRTIAFTDSANQASGMVSKLTAGFMELRALIRPRSKRKPAKLRRQSNSR